MKKTIVSSWNEWDPLKHVIVGRADGPFPRIVVVVVLLVTANVEVGMVRAAAVETADQPWGATDRC